VIVAKNILKGFTGYSGAKENPFPLVTERGLELTRLRP